MTELSIEHILLFLIVIFLFYHFLGNCGCVKKINNFSVGGQTTFGTINLKELFLNPEKYGKEYYKKYNGTSEYWYVYTDEEYILDIPNDPRVSILNELYDNFKIISIGVRHTGFSIYDWNVYLYRESKNRLKFKFYDETNDYYNLDMFSRGMHDVGYNSDKPTIIKLEYHNYS